jgi:hypothetical protein
MKGAHGRERPQHDQIEASLQQLNPPFFT